MRTYMIPLLAFVSVLLCACGQENTIENTINGYEYVDLGLSVKWASTGNPSGRSQNFKRSVSGHGWSRYKAFGTSEA